MSEETSELWKHQKDCLAKMFGKTAFFIMADPGTGKTRIAIERVKEIFRKDSRILSTLILCPPIVVRQWEKEILRYFDSVRERVVPLQGTAFERRERFVQANAQSIFITNYETLLMRHIYPDFVKAQFQVVILDEAHVLKTHTSQRAKKVMKLAENARYRFALSGTPILKDESDLFSVFRILDHRIFGTIYQNFKVKYFENKNANNPFVSWPDWRIRPTGREEILKKIEPISFSVRKEEALDLPPLVFQERYVELSKEQRKAYDEMEKDLVSYLGESACAAPLALTKILRLAQITAGHLPLENGEIHDFGDVPRIQALSDLLEEHTSSAQVIVWAQFKQDYEKIRSLLRKLSLEWVEVTGDTSASQREESIRLFREDSKKRVFLSHPAAGGVGLNLVEASVSIYYSKSYSLGAWLQSQARNFRGGSEIHSKILSISLLAQNTLDEVIHEKLKKKEELSLDFLKSVKNSLIPKKGSR